MAPEIGATTGGFPVGSQVSNLYWGQATPPPEGEAGTTRGMKMSDHAAGPGDKLHIITRRLFEEDLRRHFAGVVVGVSDGLFKIRGYTFVFNVGSGEYRKRTDARTRVLSLADSGFIVTKIPDEVEMEALEYKISGDRLVVTDSMGFSLDINEFGPSR